MDFILGCNYWASNAGSDMWTLFDEDTVREDIRILSLHGINYIRFFPNWRDFQPVKPYFTAGGEVLEYYADCERANVDFLDEEMLERFSLFLDICAEHKIKVIVGLLTGWMSGALFIPSALYGKNLISDSMALYFEELYIKGLVKRFLNHPCIYAWDLGNECNSMGHANRWNAAAWTAFVSNAIRAIDRSRPIVSGMHSLGINNNWRIQDQARYTDILTTHPYPYWCEHTRVDPTLSLRTLLHPTAQTKFYAEIGKRPCLAEEIGTMGPMVCSDEGSAHFLRLNLFSLWSNNALGAMWWCAFDQGKLKNFPYTEQQVELELGMLRDDLTPKPVLLEMSSFSRILKNLPEISPAQADAVCLLTREEDAWGIGYMTYILARQAHLNLSFSYVDGPIPEADLYLMPSIRGVRALSKERFKELKEHVIKGASLYISLDNGILAGFEELTGLRVKDSFSHPYNGTATVGELTLPFFREQNLILENVSAEIVSRESERPFIARHRYGSGTVYTVNAPIEKNLLSKANAFSGNAHSIYSLLFEKQRSAYGFSLSDPQLLFTSHSSKEGQVIVIINFYDTQKEFSLLSDCYVLKKTLYGSYGSIPAYDACILLLTEKES